MKRFFVLVLLLCAGTARVSAQDMPVMDWIGPLVESERAGEMYRTNLGINRDGSPVRSGKSTPKKTVRTTAKTPDKKPVALVTVFTYEPSQALHDYAVKNQVKTIAQSDPARAKKAAEILSRRDYAPVYRRLIAPYGYKTNDAADALASNFLYAWVIANNASAVTPKQAAGLRTQIATLLSGNQTFASRVRRGQQGECYKLQLVTLAGAWVSARNEGHLQEYSDKIAAQSKTMGLDLRAYQLTDTGFIRK